MRIINFIQGTLIGLGLFLLVLIPVSSLFLDIGIPLRTFLYDASFVTVFMVMIIRPLSDIFIEYTWLRRLVIFRKGFGILSASIIVGFMVQQILTPDSTYFSTLFSSRFFSFDHYAIFAHLGDVSGLILLLTSNRLSQRLLKMNWKRVQKLSYVYFYSGGIYEAFFLHNSFALYALMAVTNLTVLAWGAKMLRKESDRVFTPLGSRLA